jgi:hypothetical protein
MADFKLSAWSTRNPLGIMALFISLIYGMCALLLGKTDSQLAPANQTALVYFIIFFPCAILTVFTWLVCRHHTKLYGPGDYRTDKGFLEAGRSVLSTDVGHKIQAEITSEERASIDEEASSGTSRESSKVGRFIYGKESNVPLQVARAYFVEGLVFQELQKDLRGSIRRDVLVSGVHVDGLVCEPDGAVTIVEVKILSPAGKELARRLRDCRAYLEQAIEALRKEVGANPNALLVLVVDGNEEQATSLSARADAGTFPYQIRVYSLISLMKRYGFDKVLAS